MSDNGKTQTRNGQFNICETVTCLVVMCISAFAFLTQSPLHPWNGSGTATDSSVFKTVAMMIENGYMPYKDSFDHKGPLTYIINALGNRLSYYRGVWCIEFLFLVITFYCIYRIARLRCECGFSYLITFLSIIPLFRYFQGGNLVEEYAMPFIAISLYIFLDYQMQGRTTSLQLIVCGACLACVLLLRPNMISVWMVFALMILTVNVKEGNWQALGNYILMFILGMAIVMIPVLIWLWQGDAIRDFWDAYIVFNFQYIGYDDYEEVSALGAKLSSFILFADTISCVASLAALLYELYSNKEERLLHGTYLIYVLLTLYMVAISGRNSPHYGMIMIPMYAYPLACLMVKIRPASEHNGCSDVLVVLVCIYAAYNLIWPDWKNIVLSLPTLYESREDDKINAGDDEIRRYVEAYTDPDDRISVYGNWDYVYVLCRRLHATRFSYQFPIGEVNPAYLDEYYEELSEELPKVIVIQAEREDDRILGFLDQNHYECILDGKQSNDRSLYVLTQ